jgi:hypothetical protein
MTVILGILFFSFLFGLLPFFAVGWLFAGWRPFLMTTALCALAFFVFKTWTFGWLFLPFGYFMALAGYLAGGKVRTGKEVDEILGTPTPASAGDK